MSLGLTNLIADVVLLFAYLLATLFVGSTGNKVVITRMESNLGRDGWREQDLSPKASLMYVLRICVLGSGRKWIESFDTLWKDKKSPFDFIVDGAPKDEVLLHLNLMKKTKLVDPISPGDMLVSFNVKIMRTNLNVPMGDLKNMHLMVKCVGRLNNKAVSQLQKALA